MHPVFLQTLILPIQPGRWPPPVAPITIDGIELAPKSELHITLIGKALGRELQTTLGESFAGAVVANAFDSCNWAFERGGRHLLLRKPLDAADAPRFAHSLIELVDLPAMAPFHEALARHLGRQLPIPPAHVTLYTAGRDSGIGVASDRQLRALTLRWLPEAEISAAQAPTAG